MNFKSYVDSSIEELNEYTKSIGYKQTAENIRRLTMSLDPNGSLAKSIIKEGGSGYKKDFVKMKKLIDEIE